MCGRGISVWSTCTCRRTVRTLPSPLGFPSPVKPVTVSDCSKVPVPPSAHLRVRWCCCFCRVEARSGPQGDGQCKPTHVE
jgi:hypothetical protein